MTTHSTQVHSAIEINLDGLIGPTHNYSGLSYGNVASMQNYRNISNPKEAAKQGLAKMKFLADLGIKQAVIPPQERPFFPLLYQLGYSGNEEKILNEVSESNPKLFLTCCSSSSMWTANAATISPSTDTLDNKIHITPANLISKLHRSIETPFTAFILRKIFTDPTYFCHHFPLPPHPHFADEGAANHTRFCNEYGNAGIELFVYGSSLFHKNLPSPHQFPSRQTYEASQSVARLHQLNPKYTIFAQQSPEAIDNGIFHNDVISVGNQNVFFYHEKAFVETNQVIEAIKRRMEEIHGSSLQCICVREEQISLQESVNTYLFNSQLVTLPNQTMALISPLECKDSPSVHSFLNHLIEDNTQPIKQVFYQDVRQSMQNGGGPACLRLRVVLNEKEYAHMHPYVILNDTLYDRLLAWIDHNYRDRLTMADLLDPQLLHEARIALNELTQILHLGPIYYFQY